MKTSTKTVLYGGIATVLLGPALVIGTGVSIAGGSGTFLAGGLKDMLPAFVKSFQEYEPGQTGGLLDQPLVGGEDTEGSG